MNKSFEISINIMGDVSSKIVKVEQFEGNEDYDITFHNGQQSVTVKFSDAGELVQTGGTPLDSNTLHSISEGIKKSI